MNIDFKKIDSQLANLTVSIEKSDYLPDFEQEIKNQRNKAQLKGFRKGKAPLSYIKKLYGDQLIVNMVNEKAIGALYEYLKENEIETILDPIINDENQSIEINYKDPKDFNFTFDVALSPEFDVKGVSPEDEYVKYKVVPSEKELEDNLVRIAEQAGERKTIKDSIEESDIITLMADVLLTDAEGQTEPIEAEIKVLVSDTQEKFKEAVLKLKLDDKIKVNMSDLENGKDEDFIRKYYLKLEAEDTRSYNDEIEANIVNVERMEPMEVGEALFAKMFPEEEGMTKEKVLEKLSENTILEHNTISENVLFRSLMQRMMDDTEIELPDEYLMRWAKRAQVIKPEQDETEFLAFLKNDIKWNLIKGKLIKKYGVEVQQEEIIERAKEQVKGYFGYKVATDDPYIDMIAQNLINDKEQRRKLVDEAITIKMYKEVEKDISIKSEEKNIEDFYALVEEINKKNKE